MLASIDLTLQRTIKTTRAEVVIGMMPGMEKGTEQNSVHCLRVACDIQGDDSWYREHERVTDAGMSQAV